MADDVERVSDDAMESIAQARARRDPALRAHAAKRDRMFCTPCGKWITPIRSGPAAPPMCPKCRSGRVRPPMRGEKVPEE